eukprot:g12200.t1
MAAIPMSWFCFHKLHGHELMLDQMSTFDLMKAKCTLETDRLAMERSVLKLFDRPRGQKSEVGRSAKSEEDAEGRSVEMDRRALEVVLDGGPAQLVVRTRHCFEL